MRAEAAGGAGGGMAGTFKTRSAGRAQDVGMAAVTVSGVDAGPGLISGRVIPATTPAAAGSTWPWTTVPR